VLIQQITLAFTKGMTTVKDFLEDIKLGHYWHMFEEEGYDALDFN